MTTPIGFVIQFGESIPGDVSRLRDHAGDCWQLLLDRTWRCYELRGELYEGPPVPSAVVRTHAPLTVTAVREQPAEPERGVVPDGPHTYLPGPSGWCEQLLDVGKSEPAKCLLGRIAHADPRPVQPEPKHCGNENYVHEQHEWLGMSEDGDKAVKGLCPGTMPLPRHVKAILDDLKPVAESVPVDVLDLARQHGNQRYLQGAAAPLDSRDHGQRAEALFARIEAEVRRLRAEVDAGNEGTVRLAACVDELAKQRDAMAAHADHWEAEAVALRERLERGHVCTAACRPNSHVAFVGREALDEAQAEVERLKAAAPQQDGPTVLTLPEVPEGAVALTDRHQRRWTLSKVTDVAVESGGRLPLWESGSGALRTYPALLAGSGPLTVEMAPPREPRTWPKLDDQSDDDLPAAVTVNGEVWRRCSPDGVLFSDGMSGMTLAELRTTGEVREVFDEDGADRT